KQIESGDMTVRAGATSGKGEIAQLSHAFDHMGEAIQKRNAERQEAEEALRLNEKQIKLHLNRITALREIDMAITGSLDLRVTLNVILNQVTSQLNVDAAIVLLLDEPSLILEYAAGKGFHTSALQHTRLRLGEGLAGRAALERRTMGGNIADEAACLEQSPLLEKEGFQTHYAVPLIAKGHVKGVLEAFHRTLITPNREWLDFLDTLATQTAISVDNAALFNDLEHSNIELRMAYDTTLEGWSRALDLRDKETEGHSRRVTEMTMRLAEALGLSKDKIAQFRRGALLHDIGKMAIPDSILLKPGPLTEAEWVIMRRHPIYAHELLQPIEFLHQALEIPYCHHEKWDGTGYPRGLQGDGIPIGGRIFAVVDVWDALISDRPYRPAWQQEKVIDYIKEQAGRHFDPDVVGAFMNLVKEGGIT
ncbi:MAG: HD domain-containing phosphohydrolase, partial [Syntrophales bacterium]|nr:HD domain-containing phosphohydrolase [Syntrophales bacterium]